MNYIPEYVYESINISNNSECLMTGGFQYIHLLDTQLFRKFHYPKPNQLINIVLQNFCTCSCSVEYACVVELHRGRTRVIYLVTIAKGGRPRNMWTINLDSDPGGLVKWPHRK